MSYLVFKITLVNGETVEAKGFSKIHDGVLTIEPPYSRGSGPKLHWPLSQVKTWTSEEA